MTNLPQNVTSRYARNLMIKGRNNEFHLLRVERRTHMIDGAWIANYYTIEIVSNGGLAQSAAAPTPEQAMTRCLVKHGITFK